MSGRDGYRIYRMTVRTLTPLHIGNGRELLNQYDYAIHGGHTWRINEAALLDAQLTDDPRLADQLAETPPAQLLRAHDFDPQSRFFRYVIKGTPRSTAPGAVLREQLKDAYDRPYLPGTTVKGAIRTALAWTAWRSLKLRPERARLERDRRFAAQWYEQELFSEHSGKAPNKDTLRALHISDSQPVAPERLILVNARVLNRRGTLGAPIELEALRPETELQLIVKVDRVLFSQWARQYGLHLRLGDLLDQLPQVLRAYGEHRLRRELELLKDAPNSGRLVRLYKEWQQEPLADNEFLLQLGWGTGWEAKTFGSHLQSDPEFMETLLRDPNYKMTRGRRQPGDPFPKSRRVLVKVERSPNGQMREMPVVPLGWVLVEMEEIKP
ncbi:MAG: type III-A CRISPR-associated RAMP protein Csm5 [Anaerolineae bacterium]|nr:type III-A CRISPR-associated RAMP protein Csm5 [Anaerolineae bacterium]MDW8070875.1 type III-A CRISPR-associated RAMP protein Csm5 [Anaerolineae bacterium]